MLMEIPKIQLKKPSLTASKSLYMQAPEFLRLQTAQNLDKEIGSLVESEEEITVTDANIQVSIRLFLKFEDEPMT